MTKKEQAKVSRLLQKGMKSWEFVSENTNIYKEPSPVSDLIGVWQKREVHTICEIQDSFGRIPGVGWIYLSNTMSQTPFAFCRPLDGS